MSDLIELAAPSPAVRGRRRGWIVAIVGLLVVGLVGAGFAADRWLTGEQLFVGPGASESNSMQVGQTIYVGLGPLPAADNHRVTDRVDLRSVRPLVKTNTSDATVTVLICIHATAGVSLVAGGSALDPHPFCGSVETFRTGTLDVALRANGLLLAVTPHRTGTVDVAGAHLSYRSGIRSGSQNIGGVDLTVTTP